MFWSRVKPQPPAARVLFILKNQSTYGYGHKASGLRNSAKFVSDMLNANGVASSVVIVQDNNDIDREVTKFRPTHAIIEALWVVPEKFTVLAKLHPKVQWVVRIHSEVPFLALEGVAIDWIRKYTINPNVSVAVNSRKTQDDLEAITGAAIQFLPNYYPKGFAPPKNFCSAQPVVNIGCFGAIRPMKNHLEQAIAAIKFANNYGYRLRFHVNVTRIEEGDAILKNLRALFPNGLHQLVEHGWMPHADFLKLLRMQIDLAAAVSFTETFSIVAADATSQGVPVVGSWEIPWLAEAAQADPAWADEIVQRFALALRSSKLTKQNQKNLAKYADMSQQVWLEYLS